MSNKDEIKDYQDEFELRDIEFERENSIIHIYSASLKLKINKRHTGVNVSFVKMSGTIDFELTDLMIPSGKTKAVLSKIVEKWDEINTELQGKYVIWEQRQPKRRIKTNGKSDSAI